MVWKGVQADRKMEPEAVRLASLELGLCVCVCVHLCVCPVCTYVSGYVRERACTCAQAHVCVCMCTHAPCLSVYQAGAEQLCKST